MLLDSWVTDSSWPFISHQPWHIIFLQESVPFFSSWANHTCPPRPHRAVERRYKMAWVKVVWKRFQVQFRVKDIIVGMWEAELL